MLKEKPLDDLLNEGNRQNMAHVATILLVKFLAASI